MHTPTHLANLAACVEAVRGCPTDTALHEPQGDGAIYFNVSTENAARAAAGCVLAATDAVLQQEVRSAFALVRPPGHHAEEEEAMGFCFYNSVPARSCIHRDRDRDRYTDRERHRRPAANSIST